MKHIAAVGLGYSAGMLAVESKFEDSLSVENQHVTIYFVRETCMAVMHVFFVSVKRGAQLQMGLIQMVGVGMRLVFMELVLCCTHIVAEWHALL